MDTYNDRRNQPLDIIKLMLDLKYREEFIRDENRRRAELKAEQLSEVQIDENFVKVWDAEGNFLGWSK